MKLEGKKKYKPNSARIYRQGRNVNLKSTVQLTACLYYKND
uniref:Uncharacterized protein n=1 Tax=Anguilla anguilla TaxID=7936 RepID=A0A0E9QY89_ANGAN